MEVPFSRRKIGNSQPVRTPMLVRTLLLVKVLQLVVGLVKAIQPVVAQAEALQQIEVAALDTIDRMTLTSLSLHPSR